MNSKDALGLLVLGLVMRLVPVLNPEWFLPTGVDGTNAQALWLAAMGSIEAIMGLGFLLKLKAMPALIRSIRFTVPGPQALSAPPVTGIYSVRP